MNEILESIHKDHVVIDRLLVLIQHQVQFIEEEDNLNLEFLTFVIDFFYDFIHVYHYKREELFIIFPLLTQEITDPEKDLLLSFIKEHRQMSELTQQLIIHKDRHLNHDFTTLKEMVAGLLQLEQLYRDHLKKEDEHYPLFAKKYLLNQAENDRHIFFNQELADRKLYDFTAKIVFYEEFFRQNERSG